MNTNEQTRFNNLYQEYLNALILQGNSPKTVDMYSRYVRQVSVFFYSPPSLVLTLRVWHVTCTAG